MAEAVATAVADPDEGAEQAVNIEDRLAKLEEAHSQTIKDLEAERKASAGKDSKITTLMNDKQELRKATLSKDDLLKLREEDLVKEKAEWDEQRKDEQDELSRVKKNIVIYEVLRKPGLEDFPEPFIKAIEGDSSADIEMSARKILKLFLDERDKLDNVRKVAHMPQTGSDGKKLNVPTVKEYDAMSQHDRRQWADNATLEEIEALEDASLNE